MVWRFFLNHMAQFDALLQGRFQLSSVMYFADLKEPDCQSTVGCSFNQSESHASDKSTQRILSFLNTSCEKSSRAKTVDISEPAVPKPLSSLNITSAVQRTVSVDNTLQFCDLPT